MVAYQADLIFLTLMDYKVEPRHKFEKDDLIPQLVRYLVQDQTHPRNIYHALSGENREKNYFALSILSHLRENRYLYHDDLRRLVKGTYLRKEAQDQVLQILEELSLLSPDRGGKGRILKKNVFPESLRIGK